jgi:hypothetical protein
VSPDKEAADRDHDPAFADASSEKPGILPIPAQTHDKPGWTRKSGHGLMVRETR